MARAENTDFYQSFRFHVVEPNGFLNPAAGFQAVGTPEYTVENVDYREGIYKYTRKYPGIPSTAEITLSRGVARRASNFFTWVRAVIEGGEYRTDLEIWHFHRVDPFGIDGAPSRVYRLLNAFPVRVKIAADLDSQGSDVSLEELDIAFEEFEPEIEVEQTVGTPG